MVARCRWIVVGGEGKGGLIVRLGQALSSPQMPERLAQQSVVQELLREGNRLKYSRISGYGPERGWVSICINDKVLLQPDPTTQENRLQEQQESVEGFFDMFQAPNTILPVDSCVDHSNVFRMDAGDEPGGAEEPCWSGPPPTLLAAWQSTQREVKAKTQAKPKANVRDLLSDENRGVCDRNLCKRCVRPPDHQGDCEIMPDSVSRPEILCIKCEGCIRPPGHQGDCVNDDLDVITIPPRLGLYQGIAADVSCAGDNVTYLIELSNTGECIIEHTPQLSYFEGGSPSKRSSGLWRFDGCRSVMILLEHEELNVAVGPHGNILTFKNVECKWQRELPGEGGAEMGALGLGADKALDPQRHERFEKGRQRLAAEAVERRRAEEKEERAAEAARRALEEEERRAREERRALEEAAEGAWSFWDEEDRCAQEQAAEVACPARDEEDRRAQEQAAEVACPARDEEDRRAQEQAAEAACPARDEEDRRPQEQAAEAACPARDEEDRRPQEQAAEAACPARDEEDRRPQEQAAEAACPARDQKNRRPQEQAAKAACPAREEEDRRAQEQAAEAACPARDEEDRRPQEQAAEAACPARDEEDRRPQEQAAEAACPARHEEDRRPQEQAAEATCPARHEEDRRAQEEAAEAACPAREEEEEERCAREEEEERRAQEAATQIQVQVPEQQEWLKAFVEAFEAPNMALPVQRTDVYEMQETEVKEADKDREEEEEEGVCEDAEEEEKAIVNLVNVRDLQREMKVRDDDEERPVQEEAAEAVRPAREDIAELFRQADEAAVIAERLRITAAEAAEALRREKEAAEEAAERARRAAEELAELRRQAEEAAERVRRAAEELAELQRQAKAAAERTERRRITAAEAAEAFCRDEATAAEDERSAAKEAAGDTHITFYINRSLGIMIDLWEGPNTTVGASKPALLAALKGKYGTVSVDLSAVVLRDCIRMKDLQDSDILTGEVHLEIA